MEKGDTLWALKGQNLCYCKSTNFAVLLYLANLANCVFSLIYICPANIRDRTLIVHCIDGETPNLIATKSLFLRNTKFYSRQNLLIYSISFFFLFVCFMVIFLISYICIHGYGNVANTSLYYKDYCMVINTSTYPPPPPSPPNNAFQTREPVIAFPNIIINSISHWYMSPLYTVIYDTYKWNHAYALVQLQCMHCIHFLKVSRYQVPQHKKASNHHANHTPGNVQFYIVTTWETPGNHWC